MFLLAELGVQSFLDSLKAWYSDRWDFYLSGEILLLPCRIQCFLLNPGLLTKQLAAHKLWCSVSLTWVQHMRSEKGMWSPFQVLYILVHF